MNRDGRKLIYAADDEQDILDVLREFLTNAGYEVEVFLTGDALLEAFQKKASDLVLLDIMMPGTDGLTICRKLRDISDVPIIILTAKESEADHMKGFMLGGDDYLIKPFSPSLLIVRINALFRRIEMTSPQSNEIRFGDLVYSPSAHTIFCGSTDLALTVTEFSLLGLLLESPEKAFSRDELLNHVWGVENTDVETRVTDETVRRIRKKLKQAGSSVRIAAIWGYGYKVEDGHEAHED